MSTGSTERNERLVVEPLDVSHWPAIRAIYLEGIATGNATLEASAPEWAEWDAGHLTAARLVARAGKEVVGWAALSPVSSRCVYGGVAEVSIYVAGAARGRRIGRALLTELIEASEQAGIWTLQSGVLIENEASLRLHEQCGFRRVGTRERIGQDAAGRWRDVVLLERRSTTVGT